MAQEYKKESYGLFRAWLLLLAALAAVFSLFPGRFSPFGGARTIGIMVMCMLDLLFVLIVLTQSVYWLDGVSYEQAARAGASARRRYALWHLLIFLLATVLYLTYCFWPQAIWNTSSLNDSMTSGVLIAAAAALSHYLIRL